MIIYQNPYFSVNLNNDHYSISFATEQVAVLPVVDDSKILFIKANRPIFDRPVIELPAGNVDDEETVETAALREFSEETGVKIENIDRLIRLPSLNNMPSRTNNMLNIFLLNITLDEYRNRLKHDIEVSETLLMSYGDVINSINQGKFFISPFIAVCLLFIINSKSI